jgi:isochorismate pyruvate lyase
MKVKALKSIRDEIDTIDKKVVDLIAQRAKLVHSTVAYKESKDEILTNNRIEDVIALIRKEAISKEISPNMLDDVYRILMDYMLEMEINEFNNKNIF